MKKGKKGRKLIPDEPGESCNYGYTLIAQSRDIALIELPKGRFRVYRCPWHWDEEHQHCEEKILSDRFSPLPDWETAWKRFQKEIPRLNDTYTPLLKEGDVFLVKTPKNRFTIYLDAWSNAEKFISGEYASESKEKAQEIFQRIAEAEDHLEEAKRVHQEAREEFLRKAREEKVKTLQDDIRKISSTEAENWEQLRGIKTERAKERKERASKVLQQINYSCEKKDYKFFEFSQQLESLRECTKGLPMPINGLEKLYKEMDVKLHSNDIIPYDYREKIKIVCDNLPDKWFV